MRNDKQIRSQEKPPSSNRELTDQELDLVVGGRIGPGPLALNPQPLPPG
jgi:hypothetical protein